MNVCVRPSTAEVVRCGTCRSHERDGNRAHTLILWRGEDISDGRENNVELIRRRVCGNGFCEWNVDDGTWLGVTFSDRLSDAVQNVCLVIILSS